MKKKKEEESGELVFGQRFDDYKSFKDKGIDSTTFGSTEEKPKPKTRRERFNDKYIRTKKGTLARRGTAGAQRAENREAARKRAQAAATKRRQAKTK